MAQSKNSAVIKANRLFSGVYDIGFNFKDKNYLEVKEGEVIYSRGDKSEYMYLLIDGRVKFKTYENPRQPKIFLVSKNDFFGEKELIDKVARNSSAVAEKDSTLFRIGHKDFIKITASHKRILENLQEQKYEEVIAPSRKTELKEDIFKRILNETEVPVRKETGIELRDYSAENPLLELKARDEINEELKIYSEDEDDLKLNDNDLLIDDDGVIWEFNEEEKLEITDLAQDPVSPPEQPEEVPAENIPDEEIPEIEKKDIPEIEREDIPPYKEPEPEENILDDFLKIREKVNELSESLKEDDEDLIQTPEPEPFRFQTAVPEPAFFTAIEKFSAGIEKEEIDKLIVEACTELVNAEKGVLYFPDGDGCLKGKLYEEDSELTPAPDTIPVRSFQNSELINIKDVFNDTGFNPSADYISYFHIHSLICLPIKNGENVKAVLQLFNSRQGEFSDNDETVLKNISPAILKSIERYERYQNAARENNQRIDELARLHEERVKIKEEIIEEPEQEITEIFQQGEIKSEEKEKSTEKQIPLKVLSEFLLQEFQATIRDIKQFNAYLQRIDIPGETKEISDIVTNQTVKIIDLVEALRGYSETSKMVSEEKQSYITVFDNIINLLAEYTEGRKVNLYKRFEHDAEIAVDSKFLYLSVFQIIKYQCDLMPFGGNIFISSVLTDISAEVIIRNATKKTDETLVITAPMEYNENTPSGLGLSLARRIIEDHNATLEVKNQTGTGIEVALRFSLA